MNVMPGTVSASKSKRMLTIIWKDGHQSLYPFSLLRAVCPCATCRGGHENMRDDPDPAVFYTVDEIAPRTMLSKLESVGQYALTFTWEDGHHYGIYTWVFLRKLCPCAVCRNPSPEST